MYISVLQLVLDVQHIIFYYINDTLIRLACELDLYISRRWLCVLVTSYSFSESMTMTVPY
jgi:hypothetical protein